MIIADIAAVFHWRLSDIEALDIQNLFYWHERAVKIFNKMNGNNNE